MKENIIATQTPNLEMKETTNNINKNLAKNIKIDSVYSFL